MKISNLILPVAALGAAVSLLTPATEAWSLLGFTIGTAQRDFRTFNNFTDTQANNNQTPDANYPGYQGADMAIWKACIEWNSRLHGDGNGDPHQPAGLGSGGANFDAVFTGSANGVGGINDNVHSELNGSQGGVLAFTESPSSNGWRIRYYSVWLWIDGPGDGFGGQNNRTDIQGIACHEYGHALGMGHSTAGGNPTMSASVALPAINQRSLAADDIAGIQAAYGTADFGTKPIISNVAVVGNQVIVTGQNFTPTLNRLWMTPAAVGDGTPIKVLALDSTNGGTQITATIPAAAGPGGIHVKVNGGNASLSNSWPFDPGAPGCPPPTNYCTGSPNSVGSGADITTSGTQIVANNDFGLVATSLPAGQNGVFFYGAGQQDVPFGNGRLCVSGQIFRLDIVQSDGSGTSQFTLDLNNPPTATGQITAGSTWNFQHWYRDPADGGAFFNVSNGVEVTFCN